MQASGRSYQCTEYRWLWPRAHQFNIRLITKEGGGGKKGTENERESERKRQRQTDRQTDRDKDRETERETDREQTKARQTKDRKRIKSKTTEKREKKEAVVGWVVGVGDHFVVVNMFNERTLQTNGHNFAQFNYHY